MRADQSDVSLERHAMLACPMCGTGLRSRRGSESGALFGEGVELSEDEVPFQRIEVAIDVRERHEAKR